MVHELVIVFVEVGVVVADAKKHLEEIAGVTIKSLVQYQAVVKVLEYIGSGAIGVIIAVDPVECESESHFEQENSRYNPGFQLVNLHKAKPFYQYDKNKEVAECE
jgi:hypothetical protein